MLAWDHYLRGMWHFHKLDAREAEKALASFERALQLDETLADAHAAIARTILSGTMYWAADQREKNRDMIFAEAKRALVLDTENINAQYTLSLASSHNGDPEAGLQYSRNVQSKSTTISLSDTLHILSPLCMWGAPRMDYRQSIARCASAQAIRRHSSGIQRKHPRSISAVVSPRPLSRRQRSCWYPAVSHRPARASGGLCAAWKTGRSAPGHA